MENTKIKRPKSIIFLAIFSVGIAWASIINIVSYKDMSDYAIFNHVGLGTTYFFMFSLIVASNLVAVWFLWKPKPVGFKIAIFAIAVNVFETVFAFILARMNIEVAKNAHIAIRESRGLQVRDEAIEFVFSGLGMSIGLVIYIGISIFFIDRLLRNKSYFESNV